MSENITLAALIIGVLHSGIRLATPYLYAALGETFGQRAGVLNLGVEGIMLLGAFTSFFTVFKTQNLLLGLLVGILTGAAMGLIMAIVSVSLQAEQGISGIGLYLFGLGLSGLLFKTQLGGVQGVNGFSQLNFCLPTTARCLSNIPFFGEVLFHYSVLVYGAFLLVPFSWWILNKTRWGLIIRAVGQNPTAADSLGISVVRVRYACLIWGGALAGVAGTSMSIALLNVFQEGITNGLGFIAVALVYFGGWSPIGVMFGTLLFSTVNALQLWAQVANLNIPSDIAVMMPYVLTVIALALPFRRSGKPAALAVPFQRGSN
ncbi:MAG TPA: ABC transporter permease [Anaerolineae bacterium]|nr:ABC transporter permease [Anaerolineae bacterium]